MFRSRRMADFWSMLSTFLISWLAANLPVVVLAPEAWQSFWQYNSDRGGDLGSIWYVLSLAGYDVARVNLLSVGLFALGCAAIARLDHLCSSTTQAGFGRLLGGRHVLDHQQGVFPAVRALAAASDDLGSSPLA